VIEFAVESLVAAVGIRYREARWTGTL